MCGIAGAVDFNTIPLLLEKERDLFADPLKYRGPDDKGSWHYHSETISVSFFHSRLSIIDVTPLGHQPMVIDDGSVVVVFNGEIYNYQGIKKELQEKGVHFTSTSDTEVLLYGYRTWGMDGLLTRLDGMFAFALFDRNLKKIFLTRDRWGKKPLYYYWQNGHLVFSSDIRSFKAIAALRLTLNHFAIGYFFAEYGTPRLESCWREVFKVPPAHYLTFATDASCTSVNYSQLEYTNDCKLARQDLIQKVDSLLTNAVKKRLVGDVRVSALLSGGIDSSLIVAKMATLASGQRVKTYSVGFKQENFNELPFARKVADRFNTDHTELIVGATDFDKVDSLIEEYGEPFADASMIPSYLMCKAIAKSEKVVLGGDGGDELFGGYDSYYFALKYEKVKHLRSLYPVAAVMRNIMPGYRLDFLYRLLKQARKPSYTLLHRGFCFSSSELRRLCPDMEFHYALDREHEAIWHDNSNKVHQSDLIRLLQASLSTRLLNDYLVKVDRASMYASIEMRSPFLDKELAEFCATLTPQQIFSKQEPKSILKDISLNYFDESFVYRKKMGFGIPVGKWFRDELNGKLKDVLLGSKQEMLPLNYKYIRELILEHTSGRSSHSEKLWSLYVFHIWANKQ